MTVERGDDPVHVVLFGGLTVTVGDLVITRADWPTRRSADLVALLAVTEGHELGRDRVVESLWPHLSPLAGAANLRKAAHFARQTLACEQAVRLTSGRVALFPGRVLQVDLDAFERRARDVLRAGDREAARILAESYDAEVLPDHPYVDWAQQPRERVRACLVMVLRQARDWEAVVALEPSDEDAHRELMRDALDHGRPHAAIRWYGRLRTALEREVGLAPSLTLRAVYQECVDSLPPTPALLGRQPELARLSAVLASAENAPPTALVIRGAAGIGKSMLCRELAAVAKQGRWRVSIVSAGPDRGAYAALAATVAQLLTADRTLLDSLPRAARPVLAELTALAGPATAGPDGVTRHNVVGAVERLVAAHRGVRGVLVIIDDAHLADEATIEACEQLARAVGEVPILVALAYRPESAAPVLASAVAGLDRAGRCAAIDLGPMADDEIQAVVEAEAPTTKDPAVVGRVVAMADGNPYFAVELARAASGTSTPALAWAAIADRTLDLDPATVALLRRLAVIGDDLDPFDVPALTGLAQEEAFALLDAALDGGALVAEGTHYRFRHDLLRQALIEQVLPHRRPAIHRDAARGLGAAGAAPSLVARHWLGAGRLDDAEPWLLAAARRAWTLGAFADSLGELGPLLSHRPEHPAALRLRAEVLDALGDRRAPTAYAAAARVADHSEADDLHAMQALAEIKQGDPITALSTLEGLAPQSVPGRLAQALALSGAAVMGFATAELGSALAAECRQIALRSGDRATLVVASWAQAAAAHARDNLRESLWADLLDTAALRELAVSVFDGHLCISQRLLYGARPYSEVVAFAEAFRDESERLGAGRGLAFATTLRGEARLLSGALDEADSDLRDAARLSRAVGAATGEALALQRQAEVAVYRGDERWAAALLDDALGVARESDVGFHLFDRIYGTRITAATDPETAMERLTEAERSVRGPLETCPGCRITLSAPAAIAAARGGDLDRAERYAAETETLATVVMRLPGWDATLQEVRGYLAAAHGNPARARRHFREAAAGFATAGQPLDANRCFTAASDPTGNVSGTPV